MFRKVFVQILALALIVLGLFAIPAGVQAGGVCGGMYVVETGDTIDMLAAMCGTSANAIYAANPGISGRLYAGQVLTIPGLNYTTPSTPAVNYDPPASNTGTYIVQYGDTFSMIANRYGVSLYDLWGANPQIWDINLLYAGQVIYIPAPYSVVTSPISTGEPTALSYSGDIPKNAPRGSVRLVNKAGADVYISLRTARADGTNAVNEYPVNGTVHAEIPSGWIDYVAWVGGVKYTGGFQLQEGSIHTITFNKSKVVVD